MKKERELLSRIEALPEPRHLFVLPAWADSGTLDRLITENYLSCVHLQRDNEGAVLVAMGLKLTEKGHRLNQPMPEWSQIVWKGSLAGASFTGLTVLILYLG